MSVINPQLVALSVLPSILQMSGILFSKTPRRDSPVPPPVATPNKPQGDSFARPAPKGAWLCDEDYKYPMKSSKNPLEMCNEILERHDEKTYAELKEEINFLMVVAGLFLAIVAAFTIESYKFLQEDKQDTMSDLLVEVVRLLNDTSAQGKAQLPKPFTPKHHAIVVNQLWFLSMILSLIAVAMGTFCLQWISALSRGSDLTAKSISPNQSLWQRQLHHEGLDGWGVRYAPEALLFIVQLSIGLFICGLVYFLWNVSETAAIPTLVMTGITAASLCLINLLPLLQLLVGALLPATLKVSQCPYKSPTSWFIYNAGIVLHEIPDVFLDLLSRDWAGLCRRLTRWPIDVTGFDWKVYDRACLTSRSNTRPPLSYFKSGLISALDRFPYEREAEDIISSYLEYLVHFFRSATQWENFSQQTLYDDERSFLDGDYYRFAHRLPRPLNTVGLQLERASRIRVDFLSALILQHLTKNRSRLTSQLLRRRIELYIRVKNSSEFILSGDGSRLGFRSLDCPFNERYHSIDMIIEELDLDLKFQFLGCVRHLIDTGRFMNDSDVISAATIVQNESALSMTLSQNIQNLSETQHMDTPAEEEHTGPLPNQSSLRNIQIGNHSNQPDSGTTSSPPNELETGGPESATHNTGAEDQFRASFESLCLEVKKQLLGLRRSDFKKEKNYNRLRDIFHLPLETEPESESTEIVIDFPDHAS